MLIEVGFQLVAGWPAVAVPDGALREAHLVEHALGQPGPVIGELLGVAEQTLHGGDDADLAAQIPGRAAVADGSPLHDAHRLTRRKPARHARRRCNFAVPRHQGMSSVLGWRPVSAKRARTSARRASISARETMPCSTIRLRMARIHFW